MRDGVARARDLALVAIEDREIDVKEKCAAVDARGVRVVKGDVEIALAVSLGERQLALGGFYAQVGLEQVGA